MPASAFPNLLIQPIASLAVATPQWTWVRVAAGDVYVQVGVGDNTTYVLWQSSSGALVPAWGNTRTVASSGGQYTTIESALSGATAGTTVLVFPGTYIAPAAGYTVPSGVSVIGVCPPALSTVTNYIHVDGVDCTSHVFRLVGGNVLQNVSMTVPPTVLNSRGGIWVDGLGSEIRSVALKGDAGCAAAGIPAIIVYAGNIVMRDICITGEWGSVLVANDDAAQVDLDGLYTDNQGVTGVGGNAAIDWRGGAAQTTQSVFSNIHLTLLNMAGFITAAEGTSFLNNVFFSNVDAGEVAFDFVDSPGVLIGCGNTGGTHGLRAANVTAGYRVKATGCSFIGSTISVLVDVPAGVRGTPGCVLPARTGSGTVSNGTALATVAAAAIGGTAYIGMPAFAVMTDNTDNIAIRSAIWVGTDLLINTTGVTSGDRSVRWFVDGEVN